MTAKEMAYATITEEMIQDAVSLIGVELRSSQYITEATEDSMVGFARGIGSRNPFYTSSLYASNSFAGGLIAHPTFLYCVNETNIAPKFPGIHAIYGGTDWEFYLPIRLGDVLKASARLVEVKKKRGEFCGEMVLQKGQIEYRNQRDELVAIATSLVFRTPRDAALERGKYLNIEKYRYTNEELAGIMDVYDAEEIRGAKARYWEEVSEGELLTPVIKGPLTSEDMIQFLKHLRTAPLLSDWTKYRLRHPAAVYWDSVFNMPDSWESSLFKDSVARAFGFPAAHDTGYQRICWLDDLVTNWMSDLSFIKRLSGRILRPNIYADTTWCRGKISRKYREEDEYMVDIEIWAENTRKEITAKGQASVSLCSKDPASLPPLVRKERQG